MINKIKELHSASTINVEDVDHRVMALKKLKHNIITYEKEILNALNKDLNKSFKEGFITEVNEVLCEIDYHIKNVKKWAKDVKVKNTFQTLGFDCFIRYKPKGRVLLIVPFNYPFNLCFIPLVGAISAGNRVLIKLSSLTPHTNEVIYKIIKSSFVAEHVTCVKKGMLKHYDDLFKYEPNIVFFTGSTSVGKKIESMCVERNIEYVTEMGGQCPCFVYEDDPSFYKSIIWAKFLNAGQTCVSINYILYNEKISDFQTKLIQQLEQQYPSPLEKMNVPTVIDSKSFQRLTKIIKEQKKNIIYGGKFNASKLLIEPTIIEVKESDLLKYGEIFGPILLICKVKDDIKKFISISKNIDASPLAAYLYSNNDEIQETFLQNINAGGYCINDAIMHLLNHNLPFGGVYTSGSGSYHGKFSFECMSFKKGVVINKRGKDNEIRYINNSITYEKAKSKMQLARKFM